MIMNEQTVAALPVLDEPITYRIKFCKCGRLQYISHLDLQRTMARVIARCNIPVWYTKGFNPHPKLVFGAPLPVGVESECELLDLRLDKEVTPETLKAMLNAKLTGEMCALDVYIPNRKFIDIAAAHYDITLKTEGASPSFAAEIEKTLTSAPLIIMKRSKSGEKETDIIPFIHNANASYDVEKQAIKISATLATGQGDNLSPAAVIGALGEKLGILKTDPIRESCKIVRTCLFDKDGKLFE